MMRKILIVDDNEMNLRLLRHMLNDDYEIIEAYNGEEALRIMKENPQNISAVLLDLIMPKVDGYEVLKQRGLDEELAAIPIIVTTISNEEGTEVKALSLGANDFITKPYNPQVIKKRLENTISLREKAAIVNAIRIDALTGLYSREAFFESAEKMIMSHPPGYYVMSSFDVDKFKVINDQYGTKMGDKVLKLIAQNFAEGFGRMDAICSRITADSFAILYPQSFIETKEIDEIRKKASFLDGSILPITFSIGRYIVEDITLSPSAMYDRASMARVYVKGRYDKHIATYDESMRNRLLKEQEIISEMNMALTNHHFEVWYQPQYNHSTKALIGAEALVRWRHPVKGLISPGIFIPIFERNGFVYEIDKYVWEEVCIFLHERQKQGVVTAPISVNISRYDLFRDDLVQVIRDLISRYQIPVSMLRLEITESAFAKSSDQVVNVVKTLQEDGFIVEIDDFGSGYSSLNTLKDVPADILKLDMRFLEGENNSTRGGNIVESIIRMTKWLGMSVIAEGVETKEQADYLSSIGCSYIQGYFYAKPMPGKEYLALLNTSKCEEKMTELSVLETLDNDAFWNPNSMETLIFNSYVGGACVFELYKDKVEILRVNPRYVQILGGGKMSMNEVMKIAWLDYTSKTEAQSITECIHKAIDSGKEVSNEVKLVNIRGTGEILSIYAIVRVIAQTDNRYLFYCMIEDRTLQREAERNEEKIKKQLELILNHIGSGVIAYRMKNGRIETLFANDYYYNIRRYTREQYNAEVSNPFRLIHIEERNLVKERVESSLANGNTITVKYRTFTREGYEIWIKNTISSAYLNGPNDNIQISIISDITQEKVNEERLQLSEEKLRFMNKTLNDFMDDTPGGFTRIQICENGAAYGIFVNKGYCSLLGYSDIYIMRHFCKNAYWGIHPDDMESVKENIQEMIRTHETRSMKYRLLHKGGEYRWYRAYSRISIDEKGQYFINTYFSDISEQVKLEEQRRDLIEKMPCGAAIYEYDGKKLKIIYLNSRYKELVGRDIDINKRNITTLGSIRKDERETVYQNLRESIEEGVKLEVDLHILHGNGSYIPFHLSGLTERQRDGKTVIYMTYMPITEQEIAYKEMIPIVMRAMMASSSDLSFVKDKNLVYMGCSRTFAHMVGLKDESEIIGKTDFDIFESKLAKKYRADDHKLLEGGESLVDYEEIIPSKDGITHYSSTSKYILKDSENNIIGMYGIGRDITKNLDTKNKLQLLTDSLPGGIGMFELCGKKIRPLYINEGIYELAGYSKEEYERIINDDILSIVFEDDRQMLEEQMKQVVNGMEPIDCTFRIIPKDREYCWINFKGLVSERNKNRIIINALLQDVTARQNNHIRLNASHRAMEMASKNAGITFWLLDLEERKISFEMFNDVSFLGHKGTIENMPENFIQNKDVEPEDVPAFKEMYHKIYAGAKKSECTVRLLNRHTGRYEWQHTIYMRLQDELYHTHKAIGFSINVDLEQEIKQHYRHEFNLRQEMISNSIFYYQLNLNTGMMEEYHSMYNDVLGMGKDKILDDKVRSSILGIIDEKDRDRVRDTLFAKAMLKKYHNGETSFSCVYRRELPDEGLCWVETVVSIIKKPKTGEPVAFLHCRNIDREKKDELAIKTIMDEEIESVTIIKTKTGMAHIVKIGNEIPELLQKEEFDFNDEYRKIISLKILTEDQSVSDKFYVVSEMMKELENEDVIKTIYRIREEDGSIRRKKARAFYLDETHKDIVVIRRDITDLYDEECRQQDKLQKAVERANDANKAKSIFVSNMSHDMRTPLNAVLAFSNEAILNDASEDKLREYLDKIHISGEYLLSIINDVLDMSKIEQNKVVLKPEPYSIEEFQTMINDVILKVSEEKNITFLLSTNGIEDKCILTDKVRFNQIFINLLSNAVKFTPPGGKVELIIERCEELIDGKIQDRFIVRDNGIGMSKEFLPHAFESFKQEYHKDISENNKGTGLGLSIVKELVTMMNGTITVESKVGKGTTFIVTLPLMTVEKTPASVKKRSSAIDTLKGVKILLGEDNAINTEIATTILKRQGCIVDCAINGEKVIEMFSRAERNYYDVILMDIRMPVMNGLESATTLRALDREDAKVIPIIAMSADAFDEDERVAMKAGMNDYISKPVDPQLLYEMIKKYIKK